MQLTRRGWELVGLVGVFTGLAVLLQQPIAFYLGTGLAAYGLSRQFLAVRSFLAVDDNLSVTCTTASPTGTVEDPIEVVVSGELSAPQSATVEISASRPTASKPADADSSGEIESTRILLSPGETTATATFSCSFPVSGDFTFPSPEVRLRDATDRFSETIERGGQHTVTIQPRAPRWIHIGQGGDAVTAYGNHQAEQYGVGQTPAELRQYVPGDPQRRIDWKATARFNELYVREFEAETDYEIALVVDDREAMRDGDVGRRMLDYTLEVALGLVTLAQRNSDPVGLYVVSDEGIRAATPPAAAADVYQRVRTTLHDLTGEGVDPHPRYGVEQFSRQPSGNSPHSSATVSGTAVMRSLETDESTFARVLKGFYGPSAGPVYEGADAARPLVKAVKRLNVERTANRWTVLLTTDTDRREVRNAVQTARNSGDWVSLFLTPSVLFEAEGLADLDRAYERYVDFEEFRHELDRLGRVSALEVGPGDRLQAVLRERSRSVARTAESASHPRREM